MGGSVLPCIQSSLFQSRSMSFTTKQEEALKFFKKSSFPFIIFPIQFLYENFRF